MEKKQKATKTKELVERCRRANEIKSFILNGYVPQKINWKE